MEITRQIAKEWRERMNAALAPVAKEMGMAVEIGSISYSHNEMHTKVTFNLADSGTEGIDPAAKYRNNMKSYGFMFDVTEADLGIMARDGNVFAGVAPNRPKYAYVFSRPDGKITFGTKGYFTTAKTSGRRKA